MRPILFLTFAATGFSALTLQVVWQRVLSLHAGIDLMAATTVVTAFMAGLGLGSLAGGALADRLGAKRSLLAFALSNAAIGAFVWISLWLFYDIYRRFAAQLESAAAMFAFHFLLLVIPTTLMGLPLPLLARGAVAASREIAPLVGRLYAINTLGAALGAAVAGWVLLGELGFVATVRVAGALNLAAALVVLLLWKKARPETVAPAEPAVAVTGDSREWLWPWFLMYALTGAVAIGLEVVYFPRDRYDLAEQLLHVRHGARPLSPAVRGRREPGRGKVLLPRCEQSAPGGKVPLPQCEQSAPRGEVLLPRCGWSAPWGR